MLCKQCKTENGYIRFETKEWVCRKCGTISSVILKEKIPHQKEQEVQIKDESKDTPENKPYLEKEE